MAALTEALVTIEESRKATGRSCDGCTECCRLIGVVELEKPAGVECRHCLPGQGCSIYSQRPNSCRGFSCLWLINPEFGDHWRPNLCGIVVHAFWDKVQFVCSDPAVLKREPWASDLAAFARTGLTAGYAVEVVVGSRTVRVTESVSGTAAAAGEPSATSP